MSPETKHWRSCVEFVKATTLLQLQQRINDFCKGKFVVGIQYPNELRELSYLAVISYKVLDD